MGVPNSGVNYKAGGSSALHKGSQWRRILRIERAARLLASGAYSNDDVAHHIGVTPAYLSLLKQTPEFKARMIEIATGITAQHDLDIREDLEFQKEEIASMVPLALQRLKTLALSRNENVALKATGEILDRHGAHAKVQRIAVERADDLDHNRNSGIANDILAVLRGTPLTTTTPTDDIMDEFTKGAMDASAQISITADIVTEDTLKYIDEKKLTVN
jgi:hypothetical protein